MLIGNNVTKKPAIMHISKSVNFFLLFTKLYKKFFKSKNPKNKNSSKIYTKPSIPVSANNCI